MAEDDENEPKPPVGTKVPEEDGMQALKPPETGGEPETAKQAGQQPEQPVQEPAAEAPKQPEPAQKLSAEDFSDLPGKSVGGGQPEEKMPEPPQHAEPRPTQEKPLQPTEEEPARQEAEQEEVQERPAEPAQREQPIQPAQPVQEEAEAPRPQQGVAGEPAREERPAAPVQEAPAEPERANPPETEPPKETSGMTEVKPPEDLKELQESDKEAQELISEEKQGGFDESKPRYMQFHSRPRERNFPGGAEQAKKDIAPVENEPAPRQLSKDEQVQRAIELHQQKNNAKPGFFSKLLEPIKKKLGFN